VKALLQQWKKEKSDELRAAVLALDASAPFEGTTEQWHQRAQKADVAERGALLKALKGPRVADTEARLRVANTLFNPDPRLTAAVEALLAEVPYSADSSKPAWRAAFELITASNDPHFVALASTLPQKWKVRTTMKAWLQSQFAAAIEGLPREAPAVSEAARKLIDAAPKPKPVTAAPPAKSEAALLQAVYASPSENAPRLAYADWLAAKGD